MNLQEENEVLEKNKDDYELLGITWGKILPKIVRVSRKIVGTKIRNTG